MASRIIKDRVKQTSTTTGTGTFEFDSIVPTGYQGFVAAAGSGNEVYYCIADQSGNNWEVGRGTIRSATPDKLSRATILASSSGGDAVSFGSGTKDVFIPGHPATNTAMRTALPSEGSIPFADANGEYGQNNSNLYWDNTNLRQGIGTSAPTARLHLPASTTSHASLRVPIGTAPTSPNGGDLWGDSTQKALTGYYAGIKQYYPGVIFAATATATVANTTTETTLIGSGVGTLTLPANLFAVGKTIRVRASGYFGTAAVPGTLRIRIKLGSTTILDTGAVTPTASLSNQWWTVDAEITCRTTGATGTVIGQSAFVHRNAAASNVILAWGMVNTAAVTVDTTASQVVDVTAEWNTADAANTISGSNCSIEVLN